MRSLRTRLTLVTTAIAVIAVVVTGLVSLQLVRSQTTQQAREQLAAQADVLARVPGLASATELADKATLALGGTLVALVTPEGTVEGPAADYVDPAIVAQLANGNEVSATRRGTSGLAMVEARPARNGTAVVLALPLTAIDRALGQTTGRIVFALAIGLVVAVLGAALLARVLSRPLNETAAAARRLASGERGVPMPASRTTEVADVATALRALDAALTSSEGRQREFLLSISHELRTPLTAVRGYAEALEDGLVDDPTAVGRTLVAETDRLDRFVADLLELARLEADDFSVTPTTFDVGELLQETVAAWAGRAAVLGTHVTASGGGVVTTDRSRLRQVIDGLVENALRAGGAVLVRGSDGVVEVLDTGPGLEPADLDTVFERGALRAKYRDIRAVGTGLGLSIAARLVERLGATIAVANRPEGGAVVTVRMQGAKTPSSR